MNTRYTQARHFQRGLSLIELLISLVIGMVVVGAVLVSYLSSTRTNRVQASFSAMNENAQLGLTILSRELLMAGYSMPIRVNSTTGEFVGNYEGIAVFGCDNGFVDITVLSASPTCNVAAGADATGAGIEILYEADANTTPTTTAGEVTDCIGNGLTEIPPPNGGYFLANNKYYVQFSGSGKPELHCAGVDGNASQPLVENVEFMKVWYGQADTAQPHATTPVRYIEGTSVGPPNAAGWNSIVSVRVCLLVRSDEPVADAPTDYLDCDGNNITPADRFLHRAYFTTVTLRNKMAS